MSRSSALASKATGYPIAKVATKIAIGYTLDEITNDVTGKTCACFEPALDYIVVKYPKWPFDKFVYADKSLGTQMMATGEVMSIGNSFEAAMMKAVSSIELGMDTLTHKPFEELTDDEIVALSLIHISPPCLWPSGASPAAMIFIKAMKPVPRDCSLHKKQLFL